MGVNPPDHAHFCGQKKNCKKKFFFLFFAKTQKYDDFFFFFGGGAIFGPTDHAQNSDVIKKFFFQNCSSVGGLYT